MGLPQPHIKYLSKTLSPEVMRPVSEADKSPPLSVGDPIRTVIMNYTDLCPGDPQNCVRKSHGVFQVVKNTFLNTSANILTSPQSRKTATEEGQPSTGN